MNLKNFDQKFVKTQSILNNLTVDIQKCLFDKS
jgi:hypothetical protein